MTDLWRAGPVGPVRLLVVAEQEHELRPVLAHLAREAPDAVVVPVDGTAAALLALGQGAFDGVLLAAAPGAEGLQERVHALQAAYPTVVLAALPPGADPVLWLVAPLPGDGQDASSVRLGALFETPRSSREAARGRQLAGGLLEALDTPACVVGEDGVVVAVNTAWSAFCLANGGRPDRTGPGADYLRVCEEPGAGPDGAAVGAGLRDVLSGGTQRFDREYGCHAPDVQRWFSARIAGIDVGGSRGAVISHVDVSELHDVHEALRHQSLHDALTGLPNRALLRDLVGQAVADAARTGRLVGVGVLDLDHFARFNDSLGPAAGDALLSQVADRLAGQLRSGDVLARPGGDEFVVVWRDLSSARDVEVLGARLTGVLTAPFPVGDAELHVTASTGVAVGLPGDDPAGLLVAADAAMHDAKVHARGRVRVFRDALLHGAEARPALEAGLRRALERDELVLHYQPVVDLQTGRPVGVEALARWQHPRLGLLPPDRFVREAELSGLVVALGAWAVRRACLDLAAHAGGDLEVAVNVSVRQLADPGLVDHVRQALADSGLAPARLVLEVTESAVMEDEATAGRALRQLADLGVRLAVDDFGTGYSSLLYLRRYPFAVLKLDRAFVSGLGRSPEDEAISRSVVGLARAVAATSVAEGIETQEQLAHLRSYGCDLGQGFLWSPAVPLPELQAALDLCQPLTALRPALVPAPRPVVAVAVPVAVARAGHRIASMHASGASPHTIAAALNRADSRTPSGARWTSTAVSRHLAG